MKNIFRKSNPVQQQQPQQPQQAPQHRPIEIDPTPRYGINAELIKTLEDVKDILGYMGIMVRADQIEESGIAHFVDKNKVLNSRQEKILSIAAVSGNGPEMYTMLSDAEIDILYGQAYAQFQSSKPE